MNEAEFYSRQIFLKEVGSVGQELLKNSRVLIVGAGGLGHPVGSYLVAAGVGEITLMDFDSIEASNLNRQICFTLDDIGKNKSDVLKVRLTEQNPFIKIDSNHNKITHSNANEIISKYDIIVDCCDNFSTKFLLHDSCWFLNKALVQASVYQYEGQLQVFDYRSNKELRACLRCLWPITPDNLCVSNCQQSGIIGSVVGVLGSMQAMEVIKLITSIGSGNRKGLTHTLNLLNLDMQRIKWSKNGECPLCSEHAHITSLEFENYHTLQDCEVISLKGLSCEVLDIRESDEYSKDRSSYFLRSLSNFEVWKDELSTDKSYTFVCSSGKRSLDLALKLNILGYNCYSLYGGLDSRW